MIPVGQRYNSRGYIRLKSHEQSKTEQCSMSNRHQRHIVPSKGPADRILQTVRGVHHNIEFPNGSDTKMFQLVLGQ